MSETSSLPPSLLTLEKEKTSDSFLKQAFSAYLFLPEKVNFETQGSEEKIILLLRKHWVTNFSWLSIGLFLVLSPVVLFPFLSFWEILPKNVPSSWLNFVILLWYLLTFSYLLVNFLLWYFTVSIVTNERIIDIDFENILQKKFAATTIAKIEDVTQRTGGFFRSLFDYGDVIIQTAGTEAVFYFLAVPHPEKIVRVINQLMGKIKNE